MERRSLTQCSANPAQDLCEAGAVLDAEAPAEPVTVKAVRSVLAFGQCNW
jgi:hypothetical protein